MDIFLALLQFNSGPLVLFKFAHACSADDIIDDFTGHRLWADESDRPPLVQQSVEILGSLQHHLLRVTLW